jgi:hypothetical protein
MNASFPVLRSEHRTEAAPPVPGDLYSVITTAVFALRLPGVATVNVVEATPSTALVFAPGPIRADRGVVIAGPGILAVALLSMTVAFGGACAIAIRVILAVPSIIAVFILIWVTLAVPSIIAVFILIWVTLAVLIIVAVSITVADAVSVVAVVARKGCCGDRLGRIERGLPDFRL